MPITGTQSVMAAARIAAEDAVKARYRSMDRVLSESELEQMRLEMKTADSLAIITHLTTNVTVGGTHIT